MKKYFVAVMFVFFAFECFAVCLTLRSFLYPIKFENYIVKYSNENNLDASLVASVINVESSYNHQAKSNAGACGLMQILPSTASYVCSIFKIENFKNSDLFLPQTNIEIGCLYLKYLINKFKNTNTALASYNAGETVVKNWLKNPNYSKDGKTLFKIPFAETDQYIKKINNNLNVYKNYKIYKNN